MINQPYPNANNPRASAWLEIDLAALTANYRLLDSKSAAGCRTAAAVKADGYGLGMVPVAQTLAAAGCRDFFVATLEEALTLRGALGQDAATVAVLGGLYHGAEADYQAHNIMPVLNTPDDISRWRSRAQGQGISLPAAVHLDTGMNRLGLSAAETAALHEDPQGFSGLDLQLVMSHFACADEPDHAMNPLQYQRFKTRCNSFENVPRSLANSSGIFRNPDWHFELTRPGMALYGLNPVPEAANPMGRVVTLYARVLQVRAVAKGESVGYGAGHVFEQDTQVATVALGYGDGFLRSLSGRGQLYFNGQPCPIRGRVSMDVLALEVGHLAVLPQQGDMVEVIGPQQSADDLAAAAGTIGYEILTDLGRRYDRLYHPVASTAQTAQSGR